MKTFNAQIYAITCNITGLKYIGSTTKSLDERLRGHEANYRSYCKGNSAKITLFDEIFPMNDYSISLLEDLPNTTSKELLKKEGFHQRRFGDFSVNKKLEGHGLSKEDYQKKYHANYDKAYYQKNKDILKTIREMKKLED